MTNDKVIAVLNELIETSVDGARGFQSCAEEVKEPELKAIFIQASQRCRNGAIDLQDQVRRLGGDPARTGSAAGTVHRTWVDIEAALVGKIRWSYSPKSRRARSLPKDAIERRWKKTFQTKSERLSSANTWGCKKS